MVNPNDGRPILAMVTLNEPVVDRDRLATSVRKRIPAAGPLAAQAQGVITCVIGDELAAIGLVPALVPWSDLDGPCATTWYWPEATEAMQRHRVDVIVTLSGGRGDPVARHVLLTRVMAATVETIDVASVYRGSDAMVQSRERFLTEAARVADDYLPPDL